MNIKPMNISEEEKTRIFEIMKKQTLYVEKEPVKIQPINQWVSIKECLPDKDGTYLCYLESGHVCEAYYDSTIAAEGEFPFGEWVGYYSSDTLGYMDSEWEAYDAITHWQPLPEPPKAPETHDTALSR